jgi:hypothetical protein
MQKGGIEVITVSDKEALTSDHKCKKAKGPACQVVAVRKGGMDAFVDGAMSGNEVNKANVHLLR